MKIHMAQALIVLHTFLYQVSLTTVSKMFADLIALNLGNWETKILLTEELFQILEFTGKENSNGIRIDMSETFNTVNSRDMENLSFLKTDKNKFIKGSSSIINSMDRENWLLKMGLFMKENLYKVFKKGMEYFQILTVLEYLRGWYQTKMGRDKF